MIYISAQRCWITGLRPAHTSETQVYGRERRKIYRSIGRIGKRSSTGKETWSKRFHDHKTRYTSSLWLLPSLCFSVYHCLIQHFTLYTYRIFDLDVALINIIVTSPFNVYHTVILLSNFFLLIVDNDIIILLRTSQVDCHISAKLIATD